MRIRSWGARSASVVATTAALSLAGATAASAHHCYKTDWQDAAYERLSQGGTAWLPLTELGRLVISWGDDDLGIEPSPECAEYLTSADLAGWMQSKGLAKEPLIHFRATAGGGAYYMKGKKPGSFDYLDHSDFAVLGEALVDAVERCNAAG